MENSTLTPNATYECGHVHAFSGDRSAQCAFVSANADCLDGGGIVDYTK